MHGYHPLDKHSYATLFTNQAEIPDDTVAIPDIFNLMKCDAQLAQAENHSNQARLYAA